jgi:hypothetical protein
MAKHVWVCAGLIATLCTGAYAQKSEPGTHFEFHGSKIEVPDKPTHEHVTPGGEHFDHPAQPAVSSTQEPVKPKPVLKPPGPILDENGEVIITFPSNFGPTPEQLRRQQREKLAQAERKRQKEAAIADQQRRERIVNQRNDAVLFAHSEYSRIFHDPSSSPTAIWDAFIRWQEAEKLAAKPVD